MKQILEQKKNHNIEKLQKTYTTWFLKLNRERRQTLQYKKKEKNRVEVSEKQNERKARMQNTTTKC